MSKTKTISITTDDEIRVTRHGNKMMAVIDSPEVEAMLAEVKDADIIAHVRSEGYKPDEVFEEEDLINWAHSNGYIKE